MKKIILASILFLGTGPAWATHGGREVALPVSNAEVALSMIYANPPLPMGYFEKGDYKFTGLLDYLSLSKPAQIDDSLQPVSVVSKDGTPTGMGGAVLGEYAFSSKFSFYGMIVSANLGSGRLLGRANDNTRSKLQAVSNDRPGQIFQQADFDSSSSLGIGAGINWRALGDSPDRTTFNIFFGPTLIQSEGSGKTSILEQNKASNDNLCPETYAGYGCVRRGYKSDNSDVFFQAGFQAGIPTGKFKFNPYLLVTTGAERESGSVKFDIPLETGDGGTISEREFVRGISNLAAGLNATYRPWGLSANLTGSLATPLIEAFTDLNGFEVVKFQISKSFGKYLK